VEKDGQEISEWTQPTNWILAIYFDSCRGQDLPAVRTMLVSVMLLVAHAHMVIGGVPLVSNEDLAFDPHMVQSREADEINNHAEVSSSSTFHCNPLCMFPCGRMMSIAIIL